MDFQAENISAFLDGEMSEQQAREFLAEVARDPEASAELQRMLRLRELIADSFGSSAMAVPPALQTRWQNAVRGQAAPISMSHAGQGSATALTQSGTATKVVRPQANFWKAAVPMAATVLIAAGVLWMFGRTEQRSPGSAPAVALRESPMPPAPGAPVTTAAAADKGTANKQAPSTAREPMNEDAKTVPVTPPSDATDEHRKIVDAGGRNMTPAGVEANSTSSAANEIRPEDGHKAMANGGDALGGAPEVKAMASEAAAPSQPKIAAPSGMAPTASADPTPAPLPPVAPAPRIFRPGYAPAASSAPGAAAASAGPSGPVAAPASPAPSEIPNQMPKPTGVPGMTAAGGGSTPIPAPAAMRPAPRPPATAAPAGPPPVEAPPPLLTMQSQPTPPAAPQEPKAAADDGVKQVDARQVMDEDETDMQAPGIPAETPAPQPQTADVAPAVITPAVVAKKLQIPYSDQNVMLVRSWVQKHGGQAELQAGKVQTEPLAGPPFLGYVPGHETSRIGPGNLIVTLTTADAEGLQEYIAGLPVVEKPTEVAQDAQIPAEPAATLEIELRQNDKEADK